MVNGLRRHLWMQFSLLYMHAGFSVHAVTLTTSKLETREPGFGLSYREGSLPLDDCLNRSSAQVQAIPSGMSIS